jgi:hypothetical protein
MARTTLAYHHAHGMRFKPTSDDEQARAITRLVDDSLSDADRVAVEAWASERPEITRQVSSQRRVARELRTGGPAVPERLSRAVQARVAADQGSGGRLRLGRLASVPRWRPAVAGVALAAACAVVVLLVVGISAGTSAPSIPAAATLAFAPSTGPAPAAKSSRLLDVSYGGVQYPNYAAEFAALPTGSRIDRIGGRPALTVFYRLNDGTRLSYTVFSGEPVRLPRNARAVVFDGLPFRVFRTPSGLAVVTLVRFGRTCVLAARTSQDRVLALAAAPIRAQAA